MVIKERGAEVFWKICPFYYGSRSGTVINYGYGPPRTVIKLWLGYVPQRQKVTVLVPQH